MNNRLLLGIIGFGRIVELIHLPLLKKVPQIEVKGIYDITPQRLELAAKRGFQVFDNLNELLASPVDAVLIATPPNSHYKLAAEALRQGKHVLIEKPVTLNYKEAAALEELALRVNRKITVFHNRRFDSDFLFVKQMLDKQLLGSILFVNRAIHRFGSGASFGVKSFHAEWRNEAEYGGGALLDWGVHLIDQLLELRLGDCEALQAQLHKLPWQQGGVEDYVQASLRLSNQIMLNLDINFGSQAPMPLWVIGGEKGTLFVLSEKEAYLYDKGKPPAHFTADQFPKSGAERIYVSFAACVLKGEALEVTMEQAMNTMRIIDLIRESAQERKEVMYGDPILSTKARI